MCVLRFEAVRTVSMDAVQLRWKDTYMRPEIKKDGCCQAISIKPL